MMMTCAEAAGERDVAIDAGPAGAARVYVCPRRDQLFLLPVSMRDWLEEGHLAWFVLDVVAELDTGALHRRPGGALGRPPYEPEMMCALVLYSYCGAVRSSRRIEAACRTDAAFRVICGGLVPDHATIARFVADHEQALADLFVEGLRLCAAAGLVDLSVVALDGTKLAANAALARNRDGEWIRREVAKLIAATAHDDRAPADAPQGLPGLEAAGESCSPAGRIARLKAALAAIEAEDAAATSAVKRKAQAAAAAAEHGRQVTGRKPTEPRAALARAEIDHDLELARVREMEAARAARQQAAERGEKLWAPPPCRIAAARARLQRAKDVIAAAQTTGQSAPAADRKANITDPDSRIMPTADGWVQGYNAQAIVNQHQIVLACHVSQDTGDARLYEPMINTLTRTLQAAAIPADIELVLADAGYWSEANATSPGPDRLIATMKDHKQRRAARDLGQTSGPPPPTTPIEEMEHLLRTPQGAAAYAQRSQLIEPVFGDRKHNRGIRAFRRRGLNAAQNEWAFIHLAGNMLKLYQHRSANAAA